MHKHSNLLGMRKRVAQSCSHGRNLELQSCTRNAKLKILKITKAFGACDAVA